MASGTIGIGPELSIHQLITRLSIVSKSVVLLLPSFELNETK
jgi:hypothetical protein